MSNNSFSFESGTEYNESEAAELIEEFKDFIKGIDEEVDVTSVAFTSQTDQEKKDEFLKQVAEFLDDADLSVRLEFKHEAKSAPIVREIVETDES